MVFGMKRSCLYSSAARSFNSGNGYCAVEAGDTPLYLLNSKENRSGFGRTVPSASMMTSVMVSASLS